ncbi:MAG: hypothetical protein V2I27_14600 [Erythrobacter sp.]|jgi:hypothetical protein|nr:hypothetical protein [Erythrobacter sp.]
MLRHLVLSCCTALGVLALSAGALADEPAKERSGLPVPPGATTPLSALHQHQTWPQIRIEQRVVVRISPQREGNRQNLLANLPQRALNSRFEERETGRCLPVSGIVGVQTGSGNRLLLFMRDSKIMSLNLEKACRARDFYSGFYVERAEDGKLCIERDRLQSRNGAKCEISRLRQLVAVND